MTKGMKKRMTKGMKKNEVNVKEADFQDRATHIKASTFC